MEQLEDEEVGHDVYRSRGIAQLVQDPLDTALGAHGKGDINDVDLAPPRLFDKLRQIADFLAQFRGDGWNPPTGPIVEKAHQL